MVFTTNGGRAMKKEQWRAVCGWEHWYEVSDRGRVRRRVGGRGTWAGRIMKCGTGPTHGYRVVMLHSPGRTKLCTVHRLVAAAFLGAPPQGYWVHHKNGRRTDNRLANLMYDRPSRHAARRTSRGGGLSPGDVCIIRQCRDRGVPGLVLARRFGVCRSTIYNVHKRRTWAWLDPKEPAA